MCLNICTPKLLGSVDSTNVYDHMLSLKFSFFKFMFEVVHPWTKIMVFFLEKIYIVFWHMEVKKNGGI